MPKKILTIGFELSAGDAEQEEFTSKTSLLDWDIALLTPDISEFIDYRQQYQGKASLDNSSSFRLKDSCEHWRREIKQAVDNGKTVVVFLSALQEVYIDTGEREHSGTGRNQKTTTIVSLYSNYRCLPVDLTPVNANGSAIKLCARGTDLLAPYWAEFADSHVYEVLLTADDVVPCLVTRAGDKAVGSLIRSKSSAGALLLLPHLDFYADHFLEQQGESQEWTDEAKQFAQRLLSAIVSLDKALHAAGELTPEPTWAASPEFVLERERQLRGTLLEAERRLEAAQQEKERLVEQLQASGRLRSLLYEKGKPLEHAIIEALRLIGFKAKTYEEGSSEFDVVFQSSEGRLIGEAEGKDGKAINVDKLRQLAMNIHEDLLRDEIGVSAKGVLFGNAYRLQPLSERQAAFTEKCISAAETSSTALVATADLFSVCRYLSDHDDPQFAALCRETLLKSIGLTRLPSPPIIDLAPDLVAAKENVR